MFELMLMVLGLVGAFLVTILIMGRFTVKQVARAISTRHRDTEFIIETSRAPQSWSRRYHAVLTWLTRLRRPEVAAWFEEFSRQRLIRRLLRQLRYFQRASIFTDEDSRLALVRKISEIGRQWEQWNWSQMAMNEKARTR